MGFVSRQFSRIDADLQKFESVRLTTEKICQPLLEEDFLLSATQDTSPPKWHLAHTTWFFENFVLRKFLPDLPPFKNEFNFLFNSYYKNWGPHLKKEKRNILSRPTTKEIFLYRQEITKRVIDLIHSMMKEDFQLFLESLELGINHEQQHQELLLMDIKRNFYENPLRPKYNGENYHRPYEISKITWHNIPSGLFPVGAPKRNESFSFDNEKDAHHQWIESCMISSHLVTNEDYFTFIEEGGYDNSTLWHSDGWELKKLESWIAPLYWEKNGQEWWYFTLGGMMPIDGSAPVCHVSYYEAMAFAKWKGGRLPTEFEWETAAKQEKLDGVFLEERYLDPIPSGEDFQTFSQIHGSVWEWTQSAYMPYPRYEKYQRGLGEYNEKFMVNQMVMRGGSCITPRSHYRPTYRNFYYPHMRWQYGGIRLAKDLV